MLVNRVQQTEVMGKICVTDDEVKAYYEANAASLAAPPTSRCARSWWRSRPAEAGVNVAVDEAAEAKAADIHKRLVGGEPFPRLAADLSDAPSKANGGLLGEIPYTDLAPELQKEIDATEARRSRPPAPHLARLPDHQARRAAPAAARRRWTKPAIRSRSSVFEQKRRGEFQKYLVRLRTQALIEWKNDEVKKAYEAGLATQSASAAVPPR